jgi:hypothetical protein
VDLERQRPGTRGRAQHLPAVIVEIEQRQNRPPDRHADKRQYFRPELADLFVEDLPALDVLGRLQRIDAGCWPGDQVRDAETKLGEPDIIFIGEQFRNESGVPEQLPEAIRESGKVMARLRRADARVDADEKYTKAGRNAVFQPKSFPGWWQFRHQRFRSVLFGVVRWH